MRDIITVTVGHEVGNAKAIHVDGEGVAYLAELPLRPAVAYCRFGAASGQVQAFLNGSAPATVEGFSGTYIYLDNDTPGGLTTIKPNGAFQVIGRILDGGEMAIEISNSETQLDAAALTFFL